MVPLHGCDRTKGWQRPIFRETRGWCLIAVVALLMLFVEISRSRANGAPVDLALVLGVDISNSVDWTEYRLQRRGLAYAIRHPEVIKAIESGELKRIAITVVQWTGAESQVVAVPWTIVSDAETALGLSKQIGDMERLFGGHATHIAGMIAFGARLLREIPFEARRKVIDISGDGHDNVTRMPGRRRDEAVAEGVTINGLAIENEEKNLRHYYRDFVIGGGGAFVMAVQRYEDFGDGIKRKLIKEISSKLLTGLPQRPRRLSASGL